MAQKLTVNKAMIIGARQLQKFLQMRGAYKGKIDGIVGNNTLNAVRAVVRLYGEQNDMDWFDTGQLPSDWTIGRTVMASIQILFKELDVYDDNVDGLYGPNTAHALEQWQNLMRDTDPDEDEVGQQSKRWPRYSEMSQYYGPVGKNIQLFTLPYPMKLAWDMDTVITRMSLNAKCGESAIDVFDRVLEYYGADEVKRLRLDLFGGSKSVRKMRGGSRWSVHAWAAAIDIDPAHNRFRWDSTQASLDGPEYDAWWRFWEQAGWVSLGRERNFDWMHVQACRL